MKQSTRPLVALGALALALSGCSSPAASSSPAGQAAARPAVTTAHTLLSRGPHGEKAASVSTTQLTPAEVAKVRSMNATAGIVMHYAENYSGAGQLSGLRSELGRLGIKVIAVTYAHFDPAKQITDLESVIAKKPDIIVSLPIDPVASAPAFHKAAAAGIKLVFMDNIPEGMSAGTDYVSVVSSDSYGNGVTSARFLMKALDGKGQVGVIFHDAGSFVTRQRYEAFKKTIRVEAKGIQIVAEKGVSGPDFAGDAQVAVTAMLREYPDLAGIWTPWDVPAEGALAAVRTAGRSDVRIATMDLSRNMAIALAKRGPVVGVGAQTPVDQGMAEARLGAAALLGKMTPPFVALNGLPVDHANVLQAWKQIYLQDPPHFLLDAYKS